MGCFRVRIESRQVQRRCVGAGVKPALVAHRPDHGFNFPSRGQGNLVATINGFDDFTTHNDYSRSTLFCYCVTLTSKNFVTLQLLCSNPLYHPGQHAPSF
jgi:hypothetical protein